MPVCFNKYHKSTIFSSLSQRDCRKGSIIRISPVKSAKKQSQWGGGACHETTGSAEVTAARGLTTTPYPCHTRVFNNKKKVKCSINYAIINRPNLETNKGTMKKVVGELVTTKRKYYFAALAILVVVLLALLWFQQGQQDRVILIVTKSQEHTASLNPTRLQKAAALALEDYREERASDVKVAHHIITYSGDEEEGYNKAKAFLDNNNAVMALVGDFNSPGTEYMSRLAAAYEIPHLSFFATAETIFGDSPWSFSYRPRVQAEIEQMLEFLANTLESQQVTVIASEQQNLLFRAEMFSNAAVSEGLEIVDYHVFSQDYDYFQAELKQMREAEPQPDALVLFLGSYQLEHFMQQRALARMHKPVLSTGIVVHPELLPVFYAVDQEFYTHVPCFYLNLDHDSALHSFTQRYKIEAGFHRIDTLGPTIYDGFWTLYESMEQAADRQELKEALQAYSQERFIGPVAFDSNGLLRENFYVAVKIRSGRFVEVDIP